MKLQQEFHVVQTMTHPIILGQDFLQENKVSIDMANMSLHLFEGAISESLGHRSRLAVATV